MVTACSPVSILCTVLFDMRCLYSTFVLLYKFPESLFL